MTHRNPTLLFAVLALAMMAPRLSAQIALQFETEKPRYLCYEPVHVHLTVSNLSGNTLIFDGDTPSTRGSISFKIECSSGRHCKAIASLGNPANGLRLAPGESKSLDIILNQFYNLQREDVYNVTALLNHGRLPRTHISQPIQIAVQDGLPILTKNIGLPSENGEDMVIKSVQLNLLRFADIDEDIYALRVEDTENVYSTFRLGSFIDGEKPQVEVDGNSLVHILLQIRPRLFVYFVFGFRNRNLQLMQKRFYTSSDGAPPTLSKSTGYFRIEHGRVAREGVDYIERREDIQTDDSRRNIPEN